MKVSDAISRVRNISGDTSALQFTDQQCLDWINDGIRECAVQNNLLQKRASSNTVAGTSDYNLPTDILKLHSVKVDNDKLRVVSLKEFDDEYTGVGSQTSAKLGMPVVCYVWAGKLTLYPAPNSVMSLIIDYLYDAPLHLIANIAAEEINLPVGYHVRIVDYCLAQIALQDDDLNRYQLFYQQFQTGVKDLKDQPENTYDEYPSMSMAPRDMGNGWDLYGEGTY